MSAISKHQLEFDAETSLHDPRFTASIAEQGFALVRQIVPPEACRRIAAAPHSPASANWGKDLAARSPFFFQVGSDPRICALVSQLIGSDVMLWGAKVVRRHPGQAHPFHSDLETVGQPGKTVSVWVGLENTSQQSALKLITRSHSFDTTIQQVIFERGYERGEPTDEMVLEWSQERDPHCEIVQPDIVNGDAIFFDGRVWHGSDNSNTSGVRAALLLQYATPDTQIRAPAPGRFSWPLQYNEKVKPRVLIVQGEDRYGVNQTTPAPTRTSPGQSPLKSFSCHLQARDTKTTVLGFHPSPIASGSTPCLDAIACHWSTLRPGATPHRPHRHREEEVLLVLEGQVDIESFDTNELEQPIIGRMSSGDLVYYESESRHTLRNTGAKPARYVMFKWNGRTEAGRRRELTTTLFPAPESNAILGGNSDSAIAMSLRFQGGTRFLKKLHCHQTIIAPGAGYQPHRDPYDVAIIVLRGVIHVLGEDVESFGVVFCPAGELHGMHNPGAEDAEYVVLEFHGLYYRPTMSEQVHFAAHYVTTRAKRVVGRILRVGKRLLHGSIKK